MARATAGAITAFCGPGDSSPCASRDHIPPLVRRAGALDRDEMRSPNNDGIDQALLVWMTLIAVTVALLLYTSAAIPAFVWCAAQGQIAAVVASGSPRRAAIARSAARSSTARRGTHARHTRGPAHQLVTIRVLRIRRYRGDDRAKAPAHPARIAAHRRRVLNGNSRGKWRWQYSRKPSITAFSAPPTSPRSCRQGPRTRRARRARRPPAAAGRSRCSRRGD